MLTNLHPTRQRLTIPFVRMFIVAYARCFMKLPPKIRWLMGMAWTIYVGGALGMELIEGYYASLYGGQQSLSFVMLATTEGR
jgi:hypothetical protein